jgi:hypothetical protein
MDMGTLQLEPVRTASSLFYQADLKKLLQLNAKLSAKFLQILSIGRAPPALPYPSTARK